MVGLTFADRELLLQTLDDLRIDWLGSDRQLLADVCKWAQALKPEFGFEQALTRDVAVLSRYLIDHSSEQDVAAISRGALLYLLFAPEHGPSRLQEFGLLDEAFIASYAVHEIRHRLGEPSRYTPPSLSTDEQDRAERMFLDFVDRPFLSDEELVSTARRTGEGLAGLAACGLFRRLRNNVEFLIRVLQDSGRSVEQQMYARAALSYFVCDEDAIDDRLGIVGYLDDNFIAQMAVDFIEPAREPWLALLDATLGAWPFLNGILIDDGRGRRPVSEYMIINSALACPLLRGGDQGSTALIMPVSGPVPFLLGFVATLGLVQDSGQREVTEDSFRVGQKVLVDNYAVAEFAGCDTCNGRRMFKLRQYYTDRGQRLKRDRYWPISDIRRLLPVDPDRIPRGQLMYDLAHSDVLLPALEYLFNSSNSVHLASVRRRTLVVMPVASSHELANTLNIHGQPLKDVIPVGHLVENGVASWSTRFGEQEPLLIIASDLDAACRFAEEREDQVHLAIVDVQGRNANKAASLRRLQHLGIPTMAVSAERAAGDLPMDREKTAIWEWSNDDLESLLWPTEINGSDDAPGQIASYEKRLQRKSRSEINVHELKNEQTDEAFGAVKSLRTLARDRGEEQLVEMDEIVSLSFGVASCLIRCATPLEPATSAFQTVEDGLRQIAEIRSTCNYLTGPEQEASLEAERLLRELFDTLQRDNPKANTVGALVAEGGDPLLICPDRRLIPDLESVHGAPVARTLTGDVEHTRTKGGVIIPGWFGKDRMALLLMPPVASPLHLTLYDIEQRWFASFRRERQRDRGARSAASNRQRMFPRVPGWRSPNKELPPSIEAAHDSGLQELEAIQEYLRKGYRQRVCSSVRSDGTEVEQPARLVVFEGGACTFFTESREANVVTDLLENAVDDVGVKADVKRKRVSQLKVGDALLFNRGSDRDVIRTAADQILEHGLRETASLWRQALLDYSSRESLSSEKLHAQLREGGCRLKLHTIRRWLDDDQIIAPQAYRRDVEVIAGVTRDERLVSELDRVLSAIREVRSAHLRASHLLAKRVLARAVNILKAEEHTASFIEVEENVVVARVAEIDDEPVLVRASSCNCLLEGEAWHE